MDGNRQTKSPVAAGEVKNWRWILFNKVSIPEPEQERNAMSTPSAKTKNPQVMSPLMAMKTTRDYVCATCWSHLNSSIVTGGYLLVCAKYGEEHTGFVTKNYVEGRRSESIGEAYEARSLLRNLGIIANPHAGKSADQLIEELGYEEG